MLGSGLHSWEEKKQSSAQPCPLLTEAAGCVRATSTHWPGSAGHGLPCRQLPRSWPGSALHQDQGSKPALFSIGSSWLLLILKIHPLAPKPRRPAGIDAKTPPGPLGPKGDGKGRRCPWLRGGSGGGGNEASRADYVAAEPCCSCWKGPQDRVGALLPGPIPASSGRKMPFGMCCPLPFSSCLSSPLCNLALLICS